MSFEFFASQMERLAGLDFRPSSLQTHWEVLYDLDELQLTNAVSWCQHNLTKFPGPAELRTRAESLSLTPGADALRNRTPCELCDDTGWTTAGERTVKRCVCWDTNPVLLRRRERDARQAAQRQQAVRR